MLLSLPQPQTALIVAWLITMALLVIVASLAASYRRSWLSTKAQAQHWFDQAREHEADADYYRSLLGWLNKHGKPPVKAPDQDVVNARAWRERRALSSCDHTTRHSADSLAKFVASCGGRLV